MAPRNPALEALRRRTHAWLNPAEDDPPLERAFNLAMLALIIGNIVAVCIETVPSIYAEYALYFVLFEAFSITVFSIELVLRLWACVADPQFAGPSGRVRFLLHPLTVLDMLAILPFYLVFFGVTIDLRFARAIRLLRIFMLLRLVRYSASLRTLISVMARQKEELAVTFTVGLVLLLLASCLMYYLEHDAQPLAFSSIPATFWWGVITLATVGYGDIYPITPVGRLVGGIFAVLGVGLFALPAGIIASGFAEELRAAPMPTRCPHCGKDPSLPPAAPAPAEVDDAAA